VLHIVGHIFNAVADASADAARNELTAWKAIILGIVEGITEYLPISSTGHLVVTEKLLDVGQIKATEDAADTYAITIQAGAILAVVVLYWNRLLAMGRGLVGRDADGRNVLQATIIAFVPAAFIGVVLEAPIKDRLFGTGPIIAAWIVGGIVILLVARPLQARAEARGVPLEGITVRTAMIVGVAQCLALWPGTSRSLVTILAALLAGLTVPAAVEFSFLLGLLTLSAATAYDALRHGPELLDVYGFTNPALGFVVAFVAAFFAVRWLVQYLERHGIAIFGWYRLGIAALALVLVATGAL
jgi:undecaprenyl-diphosphatase